MYHRGIECSETGAPGVGSRLSSSDFVKTQTCSMAADPLPALCTTELVEEEPSMAPSMAPSTDPSMAPSTGCSYGFCTTDDDCCGEEIYCFQSYVCRPYQSSLAKRFRNRIGTTNGVRGGAAGKRSIGN